jgi:MFS family permease
VRARLLPNLTLALAAIGTLLQAGAQLFAVQVIVGTVTQAPPRSLAMYAGEYGYNSAPFWERVPPIILLLLLVALAANWRTPRRRFVLGAVGAFVLAGLFAGFVAGPLQGELLATEYADSVDPALTALAARWHRLDWVAWALALVPGVLLLSASFVPPDTPTRPGGTT